MLFEESKRIRLILKISCVISTSQCYQKIGNYDDIEKNQESLLIFVNVTLQLKMLVFYYVRECLVRESVGDGIWVCEDVGGWERGDASGAGGGGNSHPENREDAVGLLQQQYQ
jgi:hypothetical protein